MIRNLKVLMLAAMALAAFGAVNVVSAHAAEEKFHCEVENCRFTLKTDGTATTAHHVFVIKNSIGETISFTCESLTGEGTSVGKTPESLTITNASLKYDKCKSVLGEATVDFNSCDYNFAAKNGGTDAATVSIECTKAGGDAIVVTNQGCNVSVSGGRTLTGIGYHTVIEEVEKEVKKEVVTVTAKVPVGTVSVTGACGSFDLTKTPITAEYTTGNTNVIAEAISTGKAVNGWWA